MESALFSVGKYVRGSSFKTSEGVEEIFLIINSKEEISFSHELKRLYDTYMKAMEKCGLSEDTQIFSRFYTDDITNQIDTLTQSKIFDVAKALYL